MVSKVSLAVLVLSLAYVSEARLFRDLFPGKKLNDFLVEDCKGMSTLTGVEEVYNAYSRKWYPNNSNQCAKFCLKKRLNGERKKKESWIAIVGSVFEEGSPYGKCICYSSSNGNHAFKDVMEAKEACLFKPKEPEGDCEWKKASRFNSKTSNYMKWAAFNVVGRVQCEEACLAKRGEGKTIAGARLGAEGRFTNECHCYQEVDTIEGEGTWKEQLTASQTNYEFCILPKPEEPKDGECDWKKATRFGTSDFMIWAAPGVVGRVQCEKACLAKRGEGKTIGGARLGAEGRFTNSCRCYRKVDTIVGEGEWKEELTGSDTNYEFCILPKQE